jgi:hypothetical protein
MLRHENSIERDQGCEDGGVGKELTLDRIQVRELVLVLLIISCVVVLVNVRGYANSSESRRGTQ